MCAFERSEKGMEFNMKKMPKKRKIILKIFGKIKSNIQTFKHPISYKPKYNTAITLIALIITIIVLLILAGVTLNMIMGENGIIKKAQISKEKTNEAQIEEEKNLQSLENKVNDYNTREQITIEKEEYEKLKKKGTWELLASTTSQNETELDVKDLNQYNSVILICYNSYNNLVASTEISVDLLKKQGENSFFVNYNNTAPYVAYCYYKSDTSVVMRCVNNSTTKAELYGIY